MMRRRVPLPAPTILALLLAACGEGPPPALPALGATATGSLSISSGPTLVLAASDTDGTPLLGNIADATRLSSGGIAVVERAGTSILLFNSAGRLSGQAGRNGAGPGEFRAIRGIGQCTADTLFVWDAGNERMSLLDAQGKFLRAYAPAHEPLPRYCAGADAYVVWERFLNSTAPGPDAPPVRGIAQLVSSNGEPSGVLGELQAGENRPLGAVTLFAVTANGVYVGTGDTAAVVRYSRDGVRTGSLSIGDAHRPPTIRQYDAAIAALASMVPGTSAQLAELRAFMHQRFPAPKYLPAYRALLTDGAGTLLVVTSPLGNDATEVAVFDSLGRSLGELRIHGDLDIVEVGRGYLLAIRGEAGEEQRVVEYAIALKAP